MDGKTHDEIMRAADSYCVPVSVTLTTAEWACIAASIVDHKIRQQFVACIVEAIDEAKVEGGDA